MRFWEFLNEDFAKIEEVLEYIESNCQPYLRDLQKLRKVGGLLLSGRRDSSPFIVKNVRKDRRPKDTPEELHQILDKMFENKFGVRPRSQSVFCNPKAEEVKAYGQPFFIFPEGKYTVIWSETVDDLWSLLDNSDYQYMWDEEMAREKAQDEWEEDFGEGKRGHWIYKGEAFEGSENQAIEHFTDEEMEYAGEVEDEEAERDSVRREVESEMEWVPEVSEPDYVEERMEEILGETERDLEFDIIENYTEGNLDEALMHNNEIMLMCRRYVGINLRYLSEVENYLAEHRIRINNNRLEEYDRVA